MLLFLLILLAIVCSLSLLIVIVLFRLWRNPVPEESPRDGDEDEESYYNENGDHIYYDRKLIAYKKRREAQGTQNKK